MRVIYDGSIFARQPIGGIVRYFRNIIARLPSDWQPIVFTPREQSVPPGLHPRLKLHHFERYGFRPGRLSYWLEKHYFRRAYRATRADVLHPTFFDLLSRREMNQARLPLVVTVHDMIYERYGAVLDPAGTHAAEKRRAIEAADRIICVSANTRRDMAELIPGSERKAVVIPLATELSAPSTEEPTTSKPYFLFVGIRYAEYKNFSRVLQALAQVVGRGYDATLRVIGPSLSADEREQLQTLGIAANVEVCGHVDDQALAGLYQGSVALVYPSTYEGFGIPPLEAMACGTAVAASNVSSIPEVVGDAAALFDPHSVDQIAGVMVRLMEDTAYRAELISRGQARAKQFSWDKTVAATIDVYRSLSGI